eukprot:4459526-Pyramimonas_sp.AAC.1
MVYSLTATLTCLSMARCASTQRCIPGGALPDDDAACPVSDWRYNACEADSDISISRLALGAGTRLKAGATKLL